MMRRRPLLRAAAVSGAGYLAGKSAAKKAQQMSTLEAQVQDLQAAQTSQAGATSTPSMPVESPPPAAASREPSPAADRLTQLKQLGELHQAGVLTNEEFQKEKQRILASG